MKPPRAPRPAPRTLSATPPAPLRSPHASQHGARFPALAAVLAGGALLPACQDPVCGATRADELEAHGREGFRAAGDGQGSRALREIGVALGVVKHGTTTVPEPQVAGAAPAVRPVPPQVVEPPPPPPEPPVVTGGVPMPVSPEPPTPPPQGPNTTRPTSPGHPTPAVRGARRPVAPTPPPQPEMHLEGDRARVGPLPAELANPRTTRA